MKIHPLQRAYMNRMQLVYGVRVGLKRLIHPEEAAMIVARLGLDYDQYIEVACGLLHGWAEKQGWKYPYWNAVMAESTWQRIADLLKLDVIVADASDDYVEFQQELLFATEYVEWYIGMIDAKPKRSNGRASVELRAEVSKYLCQTNGVEYIIPNYNIVAESIERSLE